MPLQVILAFVFAVAMADHPPPAPAPAPAGYGYAPPKKVVKILKDDRQQGHYGGYSVDMQAENGIVLMVSGTVGSEGAIVQSGHYS